MISLQRIPDTRNEAAKAGIVSIGAHRDEHLGPGFPVFHWDLHSKANCHRSESALEGSPLRAIRVTPCLLLASSLACHLLPAQHLHLRDEHA